MERLRSSQLSESEAFDYRTAPKRLRLNTLFTHDTITNLQWLHLAFSLCDTDANRGGEPAWEKDGQVSKEASERMQRGFETMNVKTCIKGYSQSLTMRKWLFSWSSSLKLLSFKLWRARSSVTYQLYFNCCHRPVVKQLELFCSV